MNAHDCRRRKLSAQLLQFRSADKFHVNDGKRSAQPGNGGAGFLERFRHREIAELRSQWRRQLLGRNCIMMGEYNVDRPHGKPLVKWRRGTAIANPVMMFAGRSNNSAPVRCGTHVMDEWRRYLVASPDWVAG